MEEGTIDMPDEQKRVIELALESLEAKRREIEAEISALKREGRLSAVKPRAPRAAAPARRKRSRFSRLERLRRSRRMKAYWEKWRKRRPRNK